MEPALWVLAVLANLTAVQRIVFTRRMMRAEPRRARVLLPLLAAALLLPADVNASGGAERAWARGVAAFQDGQTAPLAQAFASEAALASPIGDHVRFILADALARDGDVAGARAAALSVADHHPDSRLAPRALVLASVLASQAGDEAGAQAALRRLLERYPDVLEVPEALSLRGRAGEARGNHDVAALAYRQLRVLAPTTGYAEGASVRLGVLVTGGTPLPPLSMAERIDRAERLLRGGVPKTAGDEAERIADEARDAGIVVRALRVVGDAAARLGRYEAGAKALEAAARRAPSDQQPRLRIDQARFLIRAGQDKRAIALLASVAVSAPESETAEALALQARVYDEASRDADAIALYRQIARRFPNREVAGVALWRLGWLAWPRGEPRAWTCCAGSASSSTPGRSSRTSCSRPSVIPSGSTAPPAPTCGTSATTWRCASCAVTSARSARPVIPRCPARSGRSSIRSAGATTSARPPSAPGSTRSSWRPSCARSRATTRGRSRAP